MLDITPAQEPLEPKLWRMHLDHYMTTGKLNPEILEHMDSFQQGVINEIKKSFIRIKNKHEDNIK